MKFNKILILATIVLSVFSFIALPVETNAKTLAQFEAEVEQYKQQLQAKKDQIALNDAEVAKIQKKINDIKAQIKQAEEDFKKLQEEIDESNREIKRKSEESKHIIEYYQIANGENSYLEYIFGATSITDMIYRMSVVEQLTEYNDNLMRQLEELIASNQAKQKELQAKQKSLEALNKSLYEEQVKLNADSTAIKHTMPSVEEQIKELNETIAYYKSLKCGANEDVYACEYRIAQSTGNSLPSVGAFARPMQYGYTVRGFGGKYGHLGYDLSSNNKTMPIYPIAAGSVHAIYTDACTTSSFCTNMGYWCNGNAKIVVVKHNYNGGYIYSSYVHLSSYGNIYEGKFVSRDTIIGYMGNTGCSTGPHLHLEIASCFWKNGGGCTYSGYWSNGRYIEGYTDKLINPASLVNIPGSWGNR